MYVPCSRTRVFRWRLLPTALLDTAFLESLREAATNYFADDAGSVESVAILWEAFKVTIRGHCIRSEERRVGKSVGYSVELGGRRSIKKKTMPLLLNMTFV